jgi:hypothetical protein
MTRRPLVAALAALSVLGLAACGSSSSSGNGGSAKAVNPNGKEVSPPGDIPDNQAFVAYSPPGGGFSVKVPEGWARTSQGPATIFADKLNSVRMESMSGPSAPTAATIKKDTAQIQGAQSGSIATSTVKRKAGTAVKIVYLTTGKADPVTGRSRTLAVERYEFFKNGKEAVLTLSGAKGADNVDPWRIVTDSFRWTA